MSFIPVNAAVRSSRVRWAMGAITAAVLAADQVSKSLVLGAPPGRGRAGPAGSPCGWCATPGRAAAWRRVTRWLVTLAAIAITALAAGFALRAHGPVAALSLAAVVGGAAGNLSDQAFRAPGFGRGGVVDWIHFAGRGGSLDVADLGIQLGVLGAIIAILAGERVRDPQARKALEPGKPTRAAPPACDRLAGPGPSSMAGGPWAEQHGGRPSCAEQRGENLKSTMNAGC